MHCSIAAWCTARGTSHAIKQGVARVAIEETGTCNRVQLVNGALLEWCRPQYTSVYNPKKGRLTSLSWLRGCFFLFIFERRRTQVNSNIIEHRRVEQFAVELHFDPAKYKL